MFCFKRAIYAASVAGSLAFASSQALAVDGTINFTGELLGSTCKINGNDAGTPSTVNVTLPSLSKSALGAQGASAGVTPFQLVLTECDGTSAQTRFEIGATVDTTSGALRNQISDGADVQIQVLNDQFQAIDLGTNANSQTVSIADNSATMQYYAQYYAAYGAATAGQVASQVLFSLAYN